MTPSYSTRTVAPSFVTMVARMRCSDVGKTWNPMRSVRVTSSVCRGASTSTAFVVWRTSPYTRVTRGGNTSSSGR